MANVTPIDLSAVNPAVYKEVPLADGHKGIISEFDLTLQSTITAAGSGSPQQWFSFLVYAPGPNQNDRLDTLNGYGILCRVGDVDQVNGGPNVYVVDRPSYLPDHILTDTNRTFSEGSINYFWDGRGLFQHIASFAYTDGFYGGNTYHFKITISDDYSMSIEITLSGSTAQTFSSSATTPLNSLQYDAANHLYDAIGFGVYGPADDISVGIQNWTIKFVNHPYNGLIFRFDVPDSDKDSSHLFLAYVNNPGGTNQTYDLSIWNYKATTPDWYQLDNITFSGTGVTISEEITPSTYCNAGDPVVFKLESNGDSIDIDYAMFLPDIKSYHTGGRYDVFAWVYHPSTTTVTLDLSYGSQLFLVNGKQSLGVPIIGYDAPSISAQDAYGGTVVRFNKNLRGGTEETFTILATANGITSIDFITNDISTNQTTLSSTDTPGTGHGYLRAFFPIIVNARIYGDPGTAAFTSSAIAPYMDINTFSVDDFNTMLMANNFFKSIDTVKTTYTLEWWDLEGVFHSLEMTASNMSRYTAAGLSGMSNNLFRFYPGRYFLGDSATRVDLS